MDQENDFDDFRVHTDHPLRHYDRTCPACIYERDKESREDPPDLISGPDTGKWCWWCRTDTHNDAECDCTRTIRERVGLADDDMRWIPVAERMPEKDGWYLVAFNKDNLEECGYVNMAYQTYFMADNGIWCENDPTDDLCGVTHWMPLPEPPAVEPSQA